MRTKRQARPDIDRFKEKFTKHPGGCWLWGASCTWSGYGQFAVDSRPVMAHRWLYEREVGPIADGAELFHTCGVRHCVNPSHLAQGSRSENSYRRQGLTPPRTHCKNGHEWNDDNTYVAPSGARHCRKCQYAALKRMRDRRLSNG